MLYIFLDSNIYKRQNFSTNNVFMENLVELIRKGDIQIIMQETQILECKALIKREMKEISTQIRKIPNNYLEHMENQHPKINKTKYDEYTDDMWHKFSEPLNPLIIKNRINISMMMESHFSYTPPFSVGKQHEFKDYIVIESISHYFKSSNLSQLTVVSDDKDYKITKMHEGIKVFNYNEFNKYITDEFPPQITHAYTNMSNKMNEYIQLLISLPIGESHELTSIVNSNPYKISIDLPNETYIDTINLITITSILGGGAESGETGIIGSVVFTVDLEVFVIGDSALSSLFVRNMKIIVNLEISLLTMIISINSLIHPNV